MRTRNALQHESKAKTAPEISNATAVTKELTGYDAIIAEYAIDDLCLNYLVERFCVQPMVDTHVFAVTPVGSTSTPRSYNGVVTWIGLDEPRSLNLQKGKNIEEHVTRSEKFQHWINDKLVFWHPIPGSPNKMGQFIILARGDEGELEEGCEGGMVMAMKPTKKIKRDDPETEITF